MKDIQFSEIDIRWEDMHYQYLIISFFLFSSLPVLKSVRWGILLSSIKKIDQLKLIPITTFGFMAVFLIPFRLGEFVRPYLLLKNHEVRFSKGISTIFLERMLDLAGLLVIIIYVIMNTALPQYFIKSGITTLAATVVAFSLVFLLFFKREIALRLMKPLFKILPPRLSARSESFFSQFIEGFSIIGNPFKLFLSFLLTVVIWIINGLAIYLLTLFYGINIPLEAAYVILTTVLVGISIPSAPAFIGNFQYGCIVALMLFQVDKPQAFVFANIYYVWSSLIKIILGSVSLFFLKLSFSDLRKMKKTSQTENVITT